MKRVLLLSGGLDSTALAAKYRPEQGLFVDYGQIAAQAEHRAATQVALELELPLETLHVNTGALAVGVMAPERPMGAAPASAAPEWWPFRNQLLITLAASWAVTHGFTTVLIGTVSSDSSRHRDGSTEFLEGMDGLLAMQEGGMRVEAPARHLTTAELIEASTVSDEVLGWTHSCHRANLPCANCPGCAGRAAALRETGRLQ